MRSRRRKNGFKTGLIWITAIILLAIGSELLIKTTTGTSWMAGIVDKTQAFADRLLATKQGDINGQKVTPIPTQSSDANEPRETLQPQTTSEITASDSSTPAPSIKVDGEDGEVAIIPALSDGKGGVVAAVAEPSSMVALVNKHNRLQEDYAPTDLVYPEVRFVFSEKVEKRMLREEASAALESMFEAAEEQGAYLAGASGYRSYERQKTLFDYYVKKDGLEAAITYSAYPGASEHQTGLAIDVADSAATCVVKTCFENTPEYAWLVKNAHEHGFIIRYLKGKEEITGYQYEPWHIRYVGVELATELHKSGETLEEHYGVVPVAR